jgi:hypothetical protein
MDSWRVGRAVMALVLKTSERKLSQVRILYPPLWKGGFSPTVLPELDGSRIGQA